MVSNNIRRQKPDIIRQKIENREFNIGGIDPFNIKGSMIGGQVSGDLTYFFGVRDNQESHISSGKSYPSVARRN